MNLVGNGTIRAAELLERFRDNLLGTERNNRLVNFRSRTLTSKRPIERVVEVTGEDPTQVFSTLVNEQRVMSFHGQPDKQDRLDLEQEGESNEYFDEASESQVDQTDEKLNTPLQRSRLERHLTKIHRDQVAMIEEQGVNALYLALGMLEWYEADHSCERRLAPLVLVPVLLERTERGGFKLTWDGAEIGTNLSLAALLKKDFAIDLPMVPSEEIDVDKYAAQVSAAIRDQKDWKVQTDTIALAFFSFAKFLIYKDLAPSSWPKARSILEHPVLQALFKVTEFEEIENALTDNDDLDSHRPIGQTNEVFDADSSQTLAILQAQQGKSMVIEGPPGTGKSQTIANLIAEFVSQGKRVLFVSEKGAALNVVHDNLKRAKLDQCCIEIHGTKSKKQAFYQGLKDTVEQAQPRLAAANEALRTLSNSRDTLNHYVEALHTPLGVSIRTSEKYVSEGNREQGTVGVLRGISPREAIGRLISLGPEPDTDGRMSFEWMYGWTQDDFDSKLELVASLEAQVSRLGRPAHHAFAGSKRTYISPDDKRDLARKIDEAVASFGKFRAAIDFLTNRLHLEPAVDLDDVINFGHVVDFIVSAPDTRGVDFGQAIWKTDPERIKSAVQCGGEAATIESEYADHVKPDSWKADTNGLEEGLLPPSHTLENIGELSGYLSAVDGLDFAMTEMRTLAKRLAELMGVEVPSSFWNQESLATTAKRLAAAPDLRGLNVESEKWLTEEATLRKALELLKSCQSAHMKLQGKVSPSVWTTDIEPMLMTLEKEGASVLKRWFSRRYRDAATSSTRALGLQGKVTHVNLVAMLSEVRVERQSRARLTQLRPSLLELFAERWSIEDANADELASCIDFLSLLHGDVGKDKLERGTVRCLLRQDSLRDIGKLADGLRTAMSTSSTTIGQFRTALQVHDSGAFESDTGDPNERLYRFVIDIIEPAKAIADGLFRPSSSTPTWQERLRRIDAIRRHQSATKEYTEEEKTLVKCLGSETLATADWFGLHRLIDWTVDLINRVETGVLPTGLLQFFGKGDSPKGLEEQLAELRHLRDSYSGLIDSISDRAQLDGGGEAFLQQSLDVQEARLKAWQTHVEDLESYFRYNLLSKQVHEAGIEQATQLAETWEPAGSRLAAEFKRAWYNGLLDEAVQSRPVLQEFDRKTHEEIVESFRSLDRGLIELNQTKVALSHWKTVPRGSAVGEMGFLLLQMNRQRGHKAIRIAMKEAPSAIQAIRPVFLMSPMSVAMYLPPDGPEFDVVIFDEASQIKPEDSLGSIIRAKQMIVVGDSKQMPPTSVFERMTASDDGDLESEEDQEAQDLGEQESILALASARIPEGSSNRRDLRWHYRSRHQDLILTSNRLFYKDRLVIFPHPREKDSEMGLIFRHLPSTIYSRGGSRKNEMEAKAIVEAVVKHVLESPNLTLGIVAFSKAQQEAIEDQLDLARKAEPALRHFDEQHGLDRLFVKNLETVQGDQRDVIFISVGYGRDENGFMDGRSFATLNKAGGERRLNVLITRARIRTVVFSNFRAADMRIEASQGAGVHAFHTFLAFAESGHLDAMPSVFKPEPSYFEDCVFEQLRNRGYDVTRQVGSEHFYIDLAVRNPAEPGKYSIGIECDGRMYHSAKSARDRDRLRQQVLEDRGWRIHRIWSTDWWRHPERELERCAEAIEASFRFEGIMADPAATPTEQQLIHETGEEDEGQSTPQSNKESSIVPDYILAELTWPRYQELLDTPPWQLAGLVGKVAQVEAPVHFDEIVRRIREAAGKSRAGSQIRPHIEGAVRAAERQGLIKFKMPFVYLPNQTEFVVRSRSQFPQQVKKIDLIAPEEIELAATEILRDSIAVEPDQIARPLANRLGFDRVTPEIAAHVLKVIDAATKAGRFEKSLSRLKRPAET
ncbi:MAG: DUF3320 domain-containing protein [Fimbriimonadaceae bacterium]|nr:DUF3320 domain-containing protein [Fimbriimonadaceae bacterium]